MKVDAIIVGQGLAGSLMAWQLLRGNLRVLVVDRDEAVTSSKVAAGLLTPLTGSRFNLSEAVIERLNYALNFYWELENDHDAKFFHHQTIARLFRNPGEKKAWEDRLRKDPAKLEEFHSPLGALHDSINATEGGFEMKRGGWLDVPQFLEVTRQHLLERISYAIGDLSADDVSITDTGVRWKNVEASKIIFCEGWMGNQNRFFDWITMHPALGEILDLKIPSLESENRIINSGGWMIPRGDGIFRAGSTYQHDFDRIEPSDEGEAEVMQKIRSITSAPIEVTGRKAAVRPIIKRSQVFMGVHPEHSNVAFLNGLGSKGVMNGPWYAARLAQHLFTNAPLPEEADLRSNLI
ncbi:FAD-dependent oxidoreductase [Verrucomicrobiales bacterium BCK34]|nr:FAD-dependent oxidoreductase [Verrucomicrobiales bacterium BCK34]